MGEEEKLKIVEKLTPCILRAMDEIKKMGLVKGIVDIDHVHVCFQAEKISRKSGYREILDLVENDYTFLLFHLYDPKSDRVKWMVPSSYKSKRNILMWFKDGDLKKVKILPLPKEGKDTYQSWHLGLVDVINVDVVGRKYRGVKIMTKVPSKRYKWCWDFRLRYGIKEYLEKIEKY